MALARNDAVQRADAAQGEAETLRNTLGEVTQTAEQMMGLAQPPTSEIPKGVDDGGAGTSFGLDATDLESAPPARPNAAAFGLAQAEMQSAINRAKKLLKT
jgi:hypothetical protein